jgi:DeoR/GlpR family transcriptional regulator of sugar metabolism
MIYFERQEKILTLVRQQGCVTINYLCEHIFASPSTIRRDIAEMSEKKLLARVRGGAAVLEGMTSDKPSMVRFQTNVEKKKKMASIAIRYIKNSNTLFLDSSSTTAYLAKNLEEFQDLSVVTNGIQTINILNERTSAKVFTCGGLILNNSAITGSEALKAIGNFRADTLFLSCVGFSLSGGLTEALQENAAIKREMIQHARKRILLCDSTKMNQEFFCKVCGPEEIDLIITDTRPPEDIAEALRHKLVYS